MPRHSEAALVSYLQSMIASYQRGYRSNELLDSIRPHVHEKQRWFLSMDHREVLYGGSAGGGKSDAVLAAALQYIDVPSYSALILRRTYADLSKAGALMDRANQWLTGTIMKKEDGGKRWTYPGGGKLEFGFVDSEGDKYKFQCFHPDTEILTVDGWKFVKDVIGGERVLSMNPKTRESSFQQVTKTHEYQFDGNLVDWYQRFGVSFCVTPNHSVWASTQRRDDLREYHAEDLPRVARIPQVSNWTGSSKKITGKVFCSDGHNGRQLEFSADDWLRFIGRFLTQGNCGGAASRYEIKLTQTTEPKRSELRSLLSSFNLNLHESQSFTFNHKALAEYLQQFGTSRERYIPREILGLDSERSFILFNSLIQGNGTWIKPNQAVFITASDRLKDDMMELAVYCGFRATSLQISHEDNTPGYGNEPTWRISFYRCPKDTICDSADRKKVRYKGPVYCVTVPPFHTVLIRHRGRISWSGQSAEYQFISFDELTQIPEEYYTYLFSRLRKPAKHCPLCFPGSNPLDREARKGCRLCYGSGVNPLHLVPLRQRGATNPGGTQGEWVKRHFIPKAYLLATEDEQFAHIWTKAGECILCGGKKKIEIKGLLEDCRACDGKGYTERFFVPARLEDNPSLDQVAYEMSLASLNATERAQLRHGRWDFMSDGTIFRREWIRQYGWRGDHIELYNPEGKRLIDNRSYTIFLTADTASKIKTTNDYTVICAWAMCVKTAALCLLEVFRARILVPEILPKILYLREKWKASFAIIEEASSGITIIQEAQHTNRGKGITVLPYSPHTGDKVARSQEAQIRMQSGQIYFPDTQDETIAECVNEMLLFFDPDAHDDFVDNLSMAAWYVSGQWRNRSKGLPGLQIRRGVPRPISRFRGY